MKKKDMKLYKKSLPLLCALLLMLSAGGRPSALGEEAGYFYEVFPLERNGIALHLDCVKTENALSAKNILLIHGSAYSSHEFDIDYQDYSLVRRLAREGYAVWRIDIAGYGQSGRVEDGFLPDTAYAAEDIGEAVKKIVQLSGQSKIDVLGWSWGTMTAGRFAAEHPEHIRKLILYAPILSGLGAQGPQEAFSHNTWESAAEDFQRNADGGFDLGITDPILIDMFCSSCWRYDKDSSPMGWSKDAYVEKSEKLIQLDQISVPTLILYGDKDPYMNADFLENALSLLPEGSQRQAIAGGSHIMMYEKNCYQDFQSRIIAFLEQ